ncbi:unnamed protein product [Microthlaspi erraticum]|uniref:SANTA domain-containing protein n=1 Tax=Microthlaspi erraticum TaxID=1685480 RepID=A0A6D2HZK6_9BRAS|nr:unnamed protein product [Microthlaspi erraticum]
MADYRQPNLDGDGASDCSSFQKTVILSDWWLIKCPNEFEGKRFGVSGTEIAASVESRAKRVFTSSPIIKAFDVFTIQASDGICITLRGFLNKDRLVKSGFLAEISREFIFGFPPSWEQICNSCFRDIKTISPISHKASLPILSPCKNTKGNLQDSPAESRDKSTVTEKNMAEINDKDNGRSGGDKKTARRKSLRLQSSSGHKSKLESSKVQNGTSDGSEGLDKGKSRDVENDDCETIDIEDIGRKLDEAINTDDGDHGSEGLDKAISIEVIPPADGCADNVDHVTSTSATGESRTSEQRQLKVTRASPSSTLKDLDKSSKPGKKGKSKKSGKTLKNAVQPMNYSRSKVKEAVETLSVEKTKRKIDFDVEVTPDREEKMQKTITVSTDSVGQKRSRSGRVLVSPLEFWRDQIPVYDVDRNLTQVKEGHETNSTSSKGRKSIGFSEGKKMKIK